MKKKKVSFADVYMGILLVIMYLPIVLVVIYSFNTSKLSTVWGGVSLTWYRQLFRDRSMMEALLNSLVLGVVSCTLSAVIATLGAIGMSRMKGKSKGIIGYITTIPIMIPEIILGMVFMAFFSLLGFRFGMGTLIIAHMTFCIPYIYMLVNARLVGMDESLIEAARDLGASELQVLFDIILPLIAPAVISGMLLAFAMSLDDVIISIFVTGATLNTLPIKIYTQMKTGVTPEVNALCTLMLAATVLIMAIAGMVRKKESRGE